MRELFWAPMLLFIVAVSLWRGSDAQSVTIVADGEAVRPTLSFASYQAGAGVNNSTGIQLTPDAWHSPALALAAPLWRANFAQFVSLEMSVACPSPAPLAVHFNRWTATGVGSNSETLFLANYTASALVGSEWTQVSIPMRDFATANWSLNGVERILFNLDRLSRKCVIDDMLVRTASAVPSLRPSFAPSVVPSRTPSLSPSQRPSRAPTGRPSQKPTKKPTRAPTRRPSLSPTVFPTHTPANISESERRLSASWGVDPIYDGEAGSFPAPVNRPPQYFIEYAGSVSGMGILGSVGLQLNPDPWHAPALTLPAPIYRSDVGRYAELMMYARCAQEGTPLAMRFSRWSSLGGDTSLTLSLGDYASASCAPDDTPSQSPSSTPRESGPGSGTIGRTWTKVCIPVSHFFTEDWRLQGAERIYFNTDTQYRRCWLDNLLLWTTNVPSPPPSRMPSASPTARPSTAYPTRVDAEISEDKEIITRLEAVLGVQPIFDGEFGSFRSDDVRYAEMKNGTGIKDSVGLELHPDPWHSPAYLLTAPLYRSDLSVYNELLMYARCEEEGVPLEMHFQRWTFDGVGAHSASVALGPFAEPRDSPARPYIGRQWTKIRIPLSAFATQAWASLAGAERIMFNLDPQRRVCVVDNLLLRENIGPHIVRVERFAESVLRVEMNKYYDLQDARTLANYRLTTVTQNTSDLSVETVNVTISPQSIGLFSRFEHFKDGSSLTQSVYFIHLLLPAPLRCGVYEEGEEGNNTDEVYEYFLTMENVRDPAGNPMNSTTVRVPCAEHGLVKDSPVIKLNQVGYLPQREKLAYVGEYLGDSEGGVWLVGRESSIWHWNRVQGDFLKIPRDVLPDILRGSSSDNGDFKGVDLFGVTALSNADVWVVGARGVIVHFNGTHWLNVPSPTTQNLFAIDFSPDRSIAFAVGDAGTLLRFTPSLSASASSSAGQWTVEASPTTANLRCVFVSLNGMYAGGTGGVIVSRSAPWPSTLSTSSSVLSLSLSLAERLQLNAQSKWTVQTTPTKQTVLAFEGVRTQNVISALCANNTLLYLRYGYWIIDPEATLPQTGNFSAIFRNPTNTKLAFLFGAHGAGFSLDYNTQKEVHTEAVEDLTAAAVVEERIAFAFGRNGACVRGSTISESVWKRCELPEPQDVFAAKAVPEGPLRLPFPRPDARVQRFNYTISRWEEKARLPLRLQASNYALSGEDVFLVNFSRITQPGDYRLFVEGIGFSREFRISSHIFSDAAYHTCRMLYYQRSGMPQGLQAPFAEERFTRPTDHEFELNDANVSSAIGSRHIDGAFHWSLRDSPLYANETVCPLRTRNCSRDSLRDGSGGWFDAGDYSKYMSTAAPSVWQLLVGAEVMLNRSLSFQHKNIPESHNGVPDVLNEARWEIEWMLKMQRESDGGVYNKLASEMWEWGEPHVSDLGGQFFRFFLYRTTHDTASASAIFAQAARMFAQHDSVFARTLRERALLGWDFLAKHPDPAPAQGFVNPQGHISGPYGDTDDGDNRAWLAAELYRLTCDRTYGDAYIQFIAASNYNVAFDDVGFSDFRLEAAWAFYHSADVCSKDNETADYATVRAAIRKRSLAEANGNKNQVHSNTYRNVGRTDVPEWVGWGSFTLGASQIWGILGFHLFNDSSHLDWLTLTLDTVLGANPLCVSFVTGLGAVPPRDPLHGQSRFDDETEPIPGYVVMGPYGHVTFMNPYFAAAQGNAANYPYLTQMTSPFPVLRRWSDSAYLPQYNEGQITSISQQCAMFEFLNAYSVTQVSAEEERIAAEEEREREKRFSLFPTFAPSRQPTLSPTLRPSFAPSASPTHKPTHKPSVSPSRRPTMTPTKSPTRKPTRSPTKTPTKKPTAKPSLRPSRKPTRTPTRTPIQVPKIARRGGVRLPFLGN